MSLNSNFVALFHLIAIFHYIGALGIDFMHVESGNDEYGGKFAFFTMWNQVGEKLFDENCENLTIFLHF